MNLTNNMDHDELLNIATDNIVDVVNLNMNSSAVDTSNTNIQDVNSNEPNEPAIIVSQFLQSDKLLPNLNPERSIVLYSGTTIDIETPLPAKRIKCPGPYNVSPYMMTFGSKSGMLNLI